MTVKWTEKEIGINEVLLTKRLRACLNGVPVPKNLILTYRWLERHKNYERFALCNEGIINFKKHFPNGLKVDRKGILLIHKMNYLGLFCRYLGIHHVYLQASEHGRGWQDKIIHEIDYSKVYNERQKKIANYIADYLGML